MPVIEPEADELVLREEAASPTRRREPFWVRVIARRSCRRSSSTPVNIVAGPESRTSPTCSRWRRWCLRDGGSEDEAIAALLHDSAEDFGPDVLERIVDQFGVQVARIVAGCTDPEARDEISWRERKSEHVRSLESAGPKVRRVALAEKLDNARALLR